MKWKDILIGATASLAVTVVGGIAVYYITKEPEQKQTEKLVYSVQQSASFRGGNQEVAFTSVRVKNVGDIASRRVTLNAEFAKAEIKDFSLDISHGIKEIEREIKPNKVHLIYETLLPKEAITLNLLLSAHEVPLVSVRSDVSLGVEAQDDVVLSSKNSKINVFLEGAVPLTGIIFSLVAAVFIFMFKRSINFEGISSNKNNAGFLLLHQGLVDDAIKVLTSALHSGHYDAFTLSNLASCKAIKGEHEQAKQLLRAANYRERSGHSKAIILFNEALVNLISGNKEDAIIMLKQAIEESPSQIRHYCQFSVHLDAFRSDPVIYDLIKSP